MMRAMLANAAHALPPVRGKNRLFRGLISALAQGQSFNVRRRDVNYEVCGVDLIDYYIMSQDVESPEVTALLTSVIGDQSLTFWDIGANVGGVFLPVLRSCKAVTGVAIEPNPSVAGRLLRNVQLNPELQSRCQVLSAALSDKNTLAEFFVNDSLANSGVGGLATAPNRHGFAHLVQAHRADEIAKRVGAPDVVKIDVEGFELEVLKGFGALLERDMCVVYEHNAYRFAERGQQVDEVANFLTKNGFSLTTLDGAPIDLDRDGDFVAVKGKFLDLVSFHQRRSHAHS